LKEKILKAIKEAWLTSFPQIPLPLPVQENTQLEEQADSDEDESLQGEIMTKEEADEYEYSWENSVHEEPSPRKPTDAQAHAKHEDDSDQGDSPSEEQADPHADAQRLKSSVREKFPPLKRTYADSLIDPLEQDIPPVEQTVSHAKQMNSEPQATASPVQINSHFVQGVKLGLNGEYQEAIDELSRAVEEDPDDVVANTSLGVAFHLFGQDDRALACYEAALKIDPIYAEAHYFRGNILYQHGSVREAIAGYTTAIGLKPELIEAHRKPRPEDRLTDYSPLLDEMVWIAKPAYRILILNKSLESDPGQANLFKERAAEYSRLRNYSQAIADLNSALELQPDDASALHSRGTAYEGLGKNDRALEDYQRALAINPQLSDVYLQRGVTFGQMGSLHQSIASLTEGIRLAPENPNGYFNRGMSYFQLGEFESAIEDFSQVIRLSPTDDAAYYWRGISYEDTGRQREAIADYRQFLALSQDENARAEIEARLRAWREWQEGNRNGVRDQSLVPNERQKRNQVQSGKPAQQLDLYGLIAALGERALHSTWFGSGVNCYGETAEDLYAFTDQNRPIEGHDFLRIAAGIQQTIAGDFQAFDSGLASPWIFIRAWDGSGFYIETDDTQIEQRLKTNFPAIEEVEGAQPLYAGLFIRI
jgi:tetratricopeptide (TPR) repeat protein